MGNVRVRQFVIRTGLATLFMFYFAGFAHSQVPPQYVYNRMNFSTGNQPIGVTVADVMATVARIFL